MKQVILGSFGMFLMLGLLMAEWNIYSVGIGDMRISQSVRAVERLVESEANNVQESELFHRIHMEMKARLVDTEFQYEIIKCEDQEFILHIWGNIPYSNKVGKTLEVHKRINYKDIMS